jgi:hypothetical protein
MLVVGGPRDLALLWLAQLPFAALVLSGSIAAFLPVVIVLLAGAALALGALSLVTLVLARGMDLTYREEGELANEATLALAFGVAVMLALAGGRFLLERWLGVSTLT